MSENYFKDLYSINVNEKKKQKNGLNYLSWAVAWAEVKKLFPDATYKVYEQVIEYAPDGVTAMKTKPWFDDGKTAWVKTGVTINGIEHIENLPIMDFKNKPINAEAVTSADANKSIQRSLTKACARHGLGLYIYEGEDLPEESKELDKLRDECFKMVQKKAAISKTCAEKVKECCIEFEPTGDPRLITNADDLRKLKVQLSKIKDDAMGDIKKHIIEIESTLTKTPKKEAVLNIIKEYDAKCNPNSIKDMAKAEELLHRLQKIETEEK